MVRRTMARLLAKRRGIVLLHDIHASTARAVPDLLARLKAEGFRIVHLRPKEPVESLEVAEAEAFASEKAVAADKRPPRKIVRAKPSPPQDSSSLFGWLFNQ
jgi:hypothetical protein